MNKYAERFGKIKSHANEFTRIFGRSLANYHDFILGFDVIKLDTDLKVPDNMSMRDFIQKEYGENGVKLIEKLNKY